MAHLADDPWVGFDAAPLAENPWDGFDEPETGATVEWAGRKVSVDAIRRVAEQNNTTPEQIMRLGTTPGRIESFLSDSILGSVALRASEGLQSVADTVVASGARATAGAQQLFGLDTSEADNVVNRVHNSKRKRREFLELVERGGAVTDVLGERAGRVFNNTVQSLAEIGSVAITGPTAIYSYTVGSSWENGLDEGERAGLYGADLIGHAGRSAVLEGGLTFLMGRIPGIKSLEESFTPAANNAVRRFLTSPSMKDKLNSAAKELGGWTAEGVEEMMIAAGQQLNNISSGMRGGFDWAEILESGASGVAGRGAVGAIRGVQSELNKFEKALPEVVSGTRAAEMDMERGVNPFAVRDLADADFDKETGRKSTSKQYRDSYREALNFYIDEMRRDGQTGYLAKLENDVKKLREEDRQRAERVKQSKAKAAANKGKAGESQVRIEPVVEASRLTASERATFNADEFEAFVHPFIAEGLTQPVPNINPYILAPWESETRVQRRVRTLNEKITGHKDTIKGLRKAIVDNKRLTNEQQRQALELVEENVPSAERHQFFRGVLQSTRPSAINKLINRVAKHVDRRSHKVAVGALKESFRKATNLRPEFADKVQEIKSSVSIKRLRNTEIAAELRKLVEQNPGASFDDKTALLERLEQQNVHGMTAADVFELASMVESLAYQSAAQDRLIGNEESASLRDTADSIARSIEPARRKTKASGDRSLTSQLIHEIAERPETTLLTLSPELNTQLYDKVRAARSQYKLRRAASSRFMSDVFNSVGLEHSDSLQASMAYKVGMPSTKLENWRSQKRTIGGVKMTRGEAFWLALSSRDPVAMQNMLEAGVELEAGNRKLDRMTGQALKEVFDFIGPEGEAAVDAAFEHLNTYVIDGVNDANMKMTGRPLTHKKNVVPMVKADDEYVSFLTKARSAEGMGDALADSYSHLKHREGGIGALRVPSNMDGIDMLMTHTDRMHRFAAYSTTARNAEKLLNDSVLKSAIVSKNGEAGFNHIVDAVRSEVAGYTPADKTSKRAAALNQAVAGAMIGGKLSVMMAQPLDTIVSAAYDEGGMTDVLDGVTNELTRRGPSKVYTEMKRVLSANSGEWNGRYESGHYAGEVTNGIFKDRSWFRPSTIVEHATDPLKKSELIQAAMPNYLAAKVAARRQLGIDANDFEAYENDPAWVKLVVEQWERKMVRGSNASDGMELSSALRYAKQNPLAGLVMNFYNTAGKVYSLFTMADARLDAGDRAGAARFAAAGVVSTLLFSALQTAMTLGEKEKKDKTFWQRWLARSAKNITGLHPAGGQIIADQVVGPVLGMPSYEENPILLAQTGIDAIKGTAAIYEQITGIADSEEEPEKRIQKWIDFGRSAGPLFGLPTPALIDVGQRIQRGAVFTGLQPSKPSKPKGGFGTL